ncbi:MAG TPA: CBS domain-containing protein [Candidatus Manganitrophaceae bacterium]|nr:CBS domain-containing protein [Candidatus Manganitrophaceae bacterium]
MSLKELVHREVKKIGPTTTLIDAARMMRRYKIGSAFMEEKGDYIGIVTESDLVRKALTQGISFDTPARLLMNIPLIEIDIEKSVIEANHLMHFNGIRHLAVSEKGKVVGVLSVRDLVRHFSAGKESPLSQMRDIFKPLTVLMRREIYTIDVSSTAQEAARRMDEKKIGSLMVTDEGEITGIITETDLVRKVIGYGLTASRIPVGAIMNTPIIDIDINGSIQEANQIMAAKGVRHLAVTEGGKIVGILSIRDLIGMISIRDLPRFFSTPKEG